jgi:hypothetical protein
MELERYGRPEIYNMAIYRTGSAGRDSIGGYGFVRYTK